MGEQEERVKGENVSRGAGREKRPLMQQALRQQQTRIDVNANMSVGTEQRTTHQTIPYAPSPMNLSLTYLYKDVAQPVSKQPHERGIVR